MIDLIDSHAHLQEPEFDADRTAVIERALSSGVRQIVVPGVDLETSLTAAALAEAHPGLYATAGFHPHEASRLTPDALKQIERLLSHPKVVAVGEIGLDFYRDLSPRDSQLDCLRAMLDLASASRLPVIVHCRDAWDALAETLIPWAEAARASYGDKPLGVLHYFSGSVEQARRYVEAGFLISIHTSVTHPNASMLREVALLPLDCLVVETDSPYGAPQAHRGRRNEPAYVIEAARQIAGLHSLGDKGRVFDNGLFHMVAAATSDNARRLFALPVPADVGEGAAV